MRTELPADLVEAANRCLMVGFAEQVASDQLRRLVAQGLGGVILSSRNVRDAEQLRALTDSLRAERLDVLVSLDGEGGGIGHVARTGAPETPGSFALGVVDDLAATTAVARSLAAHLVSLGITVNYAPVLDVQREPSNPIVRLRSFGADPELVARHGRAWIQAHLECGVASCAKHFPGHGSTTVDSHVGLPVDARSASELVEVDLLPFRAAIDAGVDMLMTAHVVYPALDTVPATLSRRILTDLLRGELGFAGVVVTDALEMKAIADQVGEAAGAASAVAAGADLVMVVKPSPELWWGCRDSLLAAVRSGSLPASRLVDAAGRVRELAARYATPGAVPASDPLAGLAVARRAVGGRPLPRLRRDPFVVDLFRAPHSALGWDGSDLVSQLRAVLPGADGVSFTGGPVDVSAVLAAAGDRQLVVATHDPGLRPWQSGVREALVSARPDTVLVSTGMPEGDEFCSFGRGRANLTAAAAMLSGPAASGGLVSG